MNCKNCQKEFNRNNADRPNIFCSLPCYREYTSKKYNTKTCKRCGREKISNKKVYCSKECYAEALKNLTKGSNNPHYKERIKKECPVCKKSFYVLPGRKEKKKYCSIKCSIKRIKSEKEIERRRQIMLDRNLIGKDNPSWKGGKTKLQIRIRESPKYYEWRKLVYERDDYKCIECGRGGKLEAHHIISFSKLLDMNNIKTKKEAIECSALWHTENGQTLCGRCHRKTDSYAKHN